MASTRQTAGGGTRLWWRGGREVEGDSVTGTGTGAPPRLIPPARRALATVLLCANRIACGGTSLQLPSLPTEMWEWLLGMFVLESVSPPLIVFCTNSHSQTFPSLLCDMLMFPPRATPTAACNLPLRPTMCDGSTFCSRPSLIVGSRPRSVYQPWPVWVEWPDAPTARPRSCILPAVSASTPSRDCCTWPTRSTTASEL